MQIVTVEKVKIIPEGSMEECRYVEGIVFTKNVVHKKMASVIHKPRILLLNCSLE
jgi:1-phosphatidylinositol-3-phosphate 5-kinase